MSKGGLNRFSELVGVKLPEISSLYEEVKANSARLRSCDAHTFEPLPGQEQKVMGKRYVCTACRGEVDHHAFYWHEVGRRAPV